MDAKHRAARIVFHRGMDFATGEKCYFGQWNSTKRGTSKFGGYIACSFNTIVTRPGKFGLYLDTPYYCAAGPHKYRRLPIGLTLRIALCAVRGHWEAKVATAQQSVRKVIYKVISVPAKYRNWRDMKAFEKQWGL